MTSTKYLSNTDKSKEDCALKREIVSQVDGRRSRLHHIAVEGDASESWGRFSG